MSVQELSRDMGNAAIKSVLKFLSTAEPKNASTYEGLVVYKAELVLNLLQM